MAKVEDDTKDCIKRFLKRHSLAAADIDFDANCQIFLKEMTLGLEGQKSSLQMLPTYLQMPTDIPTGEPVLVLDVGGTNFRVATMTFNQDRYPVMENFTKHPMPGSYGLMTKDEFFQALAEGIGDLAAASSRIGFCFSYPAEITSDLDGRLISLTKEIKIKNLVGELIGANLLQALKTLGYKQEKKITLLNDTVATLLASQIITPHRTYGDYLGFILGTGMNTSYIESNSAIKKISGLNRNSHMIINVESGNYGQAPRSSLDLEFDATQNNPGTYILEKMTAGAYLGNLILTVLKKGAREGFFSMHFAREINKISQLATEDVHDFLVYPPNVSNPLTMCLVKEKGKAAEVVEKYNQQDSSRAYFIIDGVIERAAFMAAINLASLIIKTGNGRDPCRPISIAVEGTTFFKLKGYAQKIEDYLKKHLTENLGYHFEFVEVKDASLIGAALAALNYKQ